MNQTDIQNVIQPDLLRQAVVKAKGPDRNENDILILVQTLK